MLERNRSKSYRILFWQDLYKSCRNMHFCRNILETNRNVFFGGNTVDKNRIIKIICNTIGLQILSRTYLMM